LQGGSVCRMAKQLAVERQSKGCLKQVQVELQQVVASSAAKAKARSDELHSLQAQLHHERISRSGHTLPHCCGAHSA
jgi:hypothetical protein